MDWFWILIGGFTGVIIIFSAVEALWQEILR